MHQFELLPSVIESVIKVRGRKRVFERLDAESTALLVVDMQNYFGGKGPWEIIKTAPEIVPNINRLAKVLRRRGGHVVWIKTTFREDDLRSWSTYFDHFVSPERRTNIIAGLKAGSPRHDLIPELDVQPEDSEVHKNRFSPFIQGASNLHEVLQKRLVDTLLITGTVTNICCEATARDASMLNYKTVMVADANAAANDFHHNATLNNIFAGFCDVQTTEQVIDILVASPSAEARAAE